MDQPELLPALDLIVFDGTNPHAVMFQLDNVMRYLASLSEELGEHDELLRQASERLLSFDLARLEQYDFGASDDRGPCLALADALKSVGDAAEALSDRLAMRYFTHIGDVGRQTLAA